MKHRKPSSFEALLEEHGDRIFRFCYRLCGHIQDAEDLAQETLIIACQNFRQFEGRSSFLTWLFRIAINRHHRLRQSERLAYAPLEEDEAAACIPDPSSERLARMSLEEALSVLPENLSEAFLLVKSEGLKYREAAVVLGVPQGTVQSRVHEATMRLRRLLSDDFEVEETQGSPCPKRCPMTEGGP